ncbi:MAG: GIY-YIG nuclease family protein [Bacteroidales bacterium]|nr:GIY-YIG nuclease family protein [Bacteroidales bacterium]
MIYYVYILQSAFDGSFYIGFTHDLQGRLFEHNHGSTRYTSHKRPWKLVYKEKYVSKTAAIKREKFLKKQKNHDFYNRLIDSQ